MCKTWSISYSCTHRWNARLSTCNGTFTVRPKPGKPFKPSCCSAPTFSVHSTQACGDCQRKQVEEELSTSLARARSQALKSGLGWSNAEQAHQDECFKLYKSFPDCRQYRSRDKPGKGRCGPRDSERGSLLKTEILPEEVMVKNEEHRSAVGWWTCDQEAWGDYKTLAEEIAEKTEDETPSLELPMTSSMGESMDDYMSAFEEGEASSTSDEDDQSEQHDESSWSTSWSAEPTEDQSWASEETMSRSLKPEAESVVPMATPLPAREPIVVRLKREAEPVWQANTSATETADASSAMPAAISRPKQTLPKQSRRPSAHRRSTFDDGRTEIELRDRFKCFRLAYLIPVGGN